MIRVFKIKEDGREYCINTVSEFDGNRYAEMGFEEVPHDEAQALFGDKITHVSAFTTSIVDGKITFNPPDDVDVVSEKFAFDTFRDLRQQKLSEYDHKISQLQRKIRQAATPEEKAKLEKQITLWDKYADMLCDLPEKDGAPWDGDMNKIPWPKMPVKK